MRKVLMNADLLVWLVYPWCKVPNNHGNSRHVHKRQRSDARMINALRISSDYTCSNPRLGMPT